MREPASPELAPPRPEAPEAEVSEPPASPAPEVPEGEERSSDAPGDKDAPRQVDQEAEAAAPAAARAPPDEPEEEDAGPPTGDVTRRATSWALTGLFVLALLYTLHAARQLLLPIVLASVLALLLTPMVDVLSRLRVPRWLNAAALVLALVGACAYGVSRLAGPAGEWMRSAPQNLAQVEERFRELMEPVARVEEAAQRVEDLAESGEEGQQEVRVQERGIRETLFSSMRGVLGGALVMFLLLYFFLASGDLFTRKLIRVMPTFRDKRRALTVARQVQVQISRYLLTITLINVALGAAVAAAMHVLGMPNPVLWGVLAALLNYIPYLGAVTGILVLTLVAMGHFDDPGRVVLVPVVYLLLTALEGGVLTPTIVGQRLRLNAVAVFVGLLFWGWLWGIAGALLAVPILVALKLVCDHYERLSPVGEFLGR